MRDLEIMMHVDFNDQTITAKLYISIRLVEVGRSSRSDCIHRSIIGKLFSISKDGISMPGGSEY